METSLKPITIPSGGMTDQTGGICPTPGLWIPRYDGSCEFVLKLEKFTSNNVWIGERRSGRSMRALYSNLGHSTSLEADNDQRPFDILESKLRK